MRCLMSIVCLLAGASAWAVELAQAHEDTDQDALLSTAPIIKPTPMTLESGGILRSYSLAIPTGYTKAKKWPLILDFHGRHGTSLGQWNDSQYFLHSRGREYFVAYPLGCKNKTETAWEGAPYANTTCNDLLFVENLVSTIKGAYSIDDTRIYASGKSNGGGFVDTLACSKTGDLFAAFAMAAAALYTDPEKPPTNCIGSRPRKILEAHGTRDTTIHIGGNKSGSTPDIALWTARWGRRDGCDPTTDRNEETTNWGLNTTFSCSGLDYVVQQYRIEGLGHCWPSVSPNTDTPDHNGTCLVTSVDFTKHVLDFFATWHN